MFEFLGLALAGAAIVTTAGSTDTPKRTPYSLQIIEGRSGRLYCLLPEVEGAATLPVAKLPRRACLKDAPWAQRGVVLDEAGNREGTGR